MCITGFQVPHSMLLTVYAVFLIPGTVTTQILTNISCLEKPVSLEDCSEDRYLIYQVVNHGIEDANIAIDKTVDMKEQTTYFAWNFTVSQRYSLVNGFMAKLSDKPSYETLECKALTFLPQDTSEYKNYMVSFATAFNITSASAEISLYYLVESKYRKDWSSDILASYDYNMTSLKINFDTLDGVSGLEYQIEIYSSGNLIAYKLTRQSAVVFEQVSYGTYNIQIMITEDEKCPCFIQTGVGEEAKHCQACSAVLTSYVIPESSTEQEQPRHKGQRKREGRPDLVVILLPSGAVVIVIFLLAVVLHRIRQRCFQRNCSDGQSTFIQNIIQRRTLSLKTDVQAPALTTDVLPAKITSCDDLYFEPPSPSIHCHNTNCCSISECMMQINKNYDDMHAQNRIDVEAVSIGTNISV